MPTKIQIGPFVPIPQEGAKNEHAYLASNVSKEQRSWMSSNMTSGTNVICKNSEVSHAIF